jgi:hypothetical protein
LIFVIRERKMSESEQMAEGAEGVLVGRFCQDQVEAGISPDNPVSGISA